MGGKAVHGEVVIAQPQLLDVTFNLKDVVYTPDWVARDMVDFFKPSGRILEPCKGEGVFLKYLPPNTDWCEITEGRDFFAWHNPVDWIIGNPPFSMFWEWINHSFCVSNDIVYILPLAKPFTSVRFMNILQKWGGFRAIRYYGGGHRLNFPIGFAVGAIHFQRDYHGPMEISYAVD